MFRFNSYLPRLSLKSQGIKYGRNLKLIGWPMIFVTNGGVIRIGDDVSINSSALSNLLGLYQRTMIVAKGKGEITIGNDVGISGAAIYSWESIKIGDHTIIGANAKIVDTDFHPTDVVTRVNKKNYLAKTSKVVIGENVFIGMNSIILKGTKLGNNCIVGAGAVVSGEYADGSMIIGNPAKTVKIMNG